MHAQVIINVDRQRKKVDTYIAQHTVQKGLSGHQTYSTATSPEPHKYDCVPSQAKLKIFKKKRYVTRVQEVIFLCGSLPDLSLSLSECVCVLMPAVHTTGSVTHV